MRPMERFITSEDSRSLVGIIKLLLGVVVLTHMLACAWYAIGNLKLGAGEPTWVSSLRETQMSLGRQSTAIYYYSTALHWSLTQFTPGSMEVVPCNSMERVFAICTLLSGLIIFSSLVSSITSAMTALRARNFERSRQSVMVNRYLSERRVSFPLGSRIIAFLRIHGYEPQEQALQEQDISALGRLPESILKDLRCETYKRTLLMHPLFRRVARREDSVFRDICHLACSQETLVQGQVLFRYGDLATKMFFISKGECDYVRGRNYSEPFSLSAPSHLCEAVLWMTWEHRGRLTANSWCELVAIDSQKFQDVVSNSSVRLSGFRRYATHFGELLLPEGSPCWERLSDLDLDSEDLDEIISCAFPTEYGPEVQEC